ncbi:hypothetical protein D9619_001580 [Psilocybe cf. subviscida]|uniref:Uncharacterized protein n=1 Tax=Psilocybe cf. subviscida TaxID=2480587 RepID=A0A8H5F3K2_9AGAR|nr:hypothetical protein D9619_001580 [Psilocybe cf. subviscida]
MTTTSSFTVIFSFCKTRPEKQSDGEQSETHDAQLQEVNVPDTLLRAADILPDEFPGEGIQCRVYQDLPVPLVPKMAELHPQASHIIVANAMTPAPDDESDFNRWYDEEHLALLSQSPLWISSKRYALLSATDNAPRYLAIHAWDGYEAFESEEYKHATNTEWKHKVVGRVLQRDREVYSFVKVISPVA